MPGVFNRLVGLETEYAIRHGGETVAQPRSRFRRYEALIASLHRTVLAVPAKHFKEGVFTANGGAVWFEAERPSAGGLIEGATPECRGPRQVVAYQRAQDELLAECAALPFGADPFALIKNDRDSAGNVYGAQENYESTFASGWTLVLWRIGLVVLFPLVVATWIGILLSVLATLSYFVLAAACYVPIQLLTGSRRSVALALFGTDLVDGRETCIHVPVWLESTLQLVTRILTAPLALSLFLLLQVAGFRRARRQLLPLLISRCVLAGAGTLEPDGSFLLADKARAINCVMGFGGMLFDRPIFSMGHFFKAIYADAWFAPREYLELFRSRQRLQIALGDSNMCETAEFLRVGTTLLVLDAIEAGAIDRVPRFKRPIRALWTFCTDPTLRAKAALVGEGAASALDIQTFYLHACQNFLRDSEIQNEEAEELLRAWERSLHDLGEIVKTGEAPGELFGTLDWATKYYLLENAGRDADWDEKKKIDLRYHELSPEGYFQRLCDAELTARVVSDDEIQRAKRTPPPSSPATMRGHYIREFASGGQPVAANWKYVFLGQGWNRTRVTLSRYVPQGETAERSAVESRPDGNVPLDGNDVE